MFCGNTPDLASPNPGYCDEKNTKHGILYTMKQLPISIIIITLNEEKNIGNILEDLQKQTYKNFEIIVSDSNSTDNTEHIVQHYAKKDARIAFYNCHTTRGPSFGRNFGVRHAQYEHLLFFDADVRIRDTHFLEKYIHYIQKYSPDVGTFYWSAHNAPLIQKPGYYLLNIGLRLSYLFSPTACGAFMFSTKTAHKAIGGFREDIHLCEDSDYVRDAKRAQCTMAVMPLSLEFNTRRLDQEGLFTSLFIYTRANLYRFFTHKSITDNTITYEFDIYNKEQKK